MRFSIFTFFRIAFIFTTLSLTLYKIIDRQNEVIKLQKTIPLLKKNQAALQWQISQLQYEKDRFQSPINLMKLAQRPEYSHLKYPTNEDVKIIDE